MAEPRRVLTYHQDYFEHVRVSISFSVSLYAPEFMRNPPSLEREVREQSYTLAAHVLGKRRGYVQIPPAPADWLEAAKERWAPAWFLKRYPLRWKRYEVEAFDVYPHAELPPGVSERMGEPVRIYGHVVTV